MDALVRNVGPGAPTYAFLNNFKANREQVAVGREIISLYAGLVLNPYLA